MAKVSKPKTFETSHAKSLTPINTSTQLHSVSQISKLSPNDYSLLMSGGKGLSGVSPFSLGSGIAAAGGIPSGAAIVNSVGNPLNSAALALQRLNPPSIHMDVDKLSLGPHYGGPAATIFRPQTLISQAKASPPL